MQVIFLTSLSCTVPGLKRGALLMRLGVADSEFGPGSSEVVGNELVSSASVMGFTRCFLSSHDPVDYLQLNE